MATMVKISKDSDLTPEYIQGKLFSFSNAAHKYHLDTNSYSEHQALSSLYSGVNDFKDEISEKLMGYLGGKRIGDIKIDTIATYSKSSAKMLAEEIIDFAYELYEWAGKKKYCDIENKAQELSGLASKTIYLLTLS